MSTPIVFPDDMARGVTGLVAEVRDALEAAATVIPHAEQGYDVRVIDVEGSYELRELVESLVAIAVKHGARP